MVLCVKNFLYYFLVVKVVLYTFNLLIVFMAFTCNEDDITLFG